MSSSSSSSDATVTALGWPALGLGGIALAMVSLPAHLWRLYVEYLWDPAPGSWVSRTASTFRILAYFMIAPFCILTLVVSSLLLISLRCPALCQLLL